MRYHTTLGGQGFHFADLRQVMAHASPARSGDYLAGIGAETAQQRMAARMVLADLPLKVFLHDALIPYESDNVTRLILDRHNAAAFAPVAHLTVGDFRNWLLSKSATPAVLSALAPGLTPEMVAAVSKLMRNQDLILVARKCQVITRFRNTIGLPGHLAVRLQPNHPTDDLRGVAASVLDGLMLGAGAVTERVADWRGFAARGIFPLPHPSWRNTGWLKRNPWFEAELLPVLRQRVAEVMEC